MDRLDGFPFSGVLSLDADWSHASSRVAIVLQGSAAA